MWRRPRPRRRRAHRPGGGHRDGAGAADARRGGPADPRGAGPVLRRRGARRRAARRGPRLAPAPRRGARPGRRGGPRARRDRAGVGEHGGDAGSHPGLRRGGVPGGGGWARGHPVPRRDLHRRGVHRGDAGELPAPGLHLGQRLRRGGRVRGGGLRGGRLPLRRRRPVRSRRVLQPRERLPADPDERLQRSRWRPDHGLRRRLRRHQPLGVPERDRGVRRWHPQRLRHRTARRRVRRDRDVRVDHHRRRRQPRHAGRAGAHDRRGPDPREHDPRGATRTDRGLHRGGGLRREPHRGGAHRAPRRVRSDQLGPGRRLQHHPPRAVDPPRAGHRQRRRRLHRVCAT